ncbi:MAG: DUF4230 domain-containing protein [Bacteroidota bacterium]
MKKIIAGAVIALASVLVYRSCVNQSTDKERLQRSAVLIQEQFQNVSKLIVTEGHFAEVYNYKDSKALFGSWLTAEKKALVVVNATVIIAYDLNIIEFDIDESSMSVHIKNIPEPEITINPDFQYYDVTADYFNPFRAEDYNAIKNSVHAQLLDKVKASSLKSNAENRLVSELSKLLLLTDSMGWKLVYEENTIAKWKPSLLRN